MQVEHKSQTVTYETTTDLDYVDLGDNLAAYRLSREWRTNGQTIPALFKELPTAQVTEGFAKLSTLRNYLKGKNKGKLPAAPDKLCLVAKDFTGLAARYGFSNAGERLGKGTSFYVENPFTALVEGTASVEQLVMVDFASHLLFDRKGETLPVAQYFDYIRAGMNDGRYDLHKALEILSKNDRVHGVDERGNEAKLEILRVAYYNSRQYCSRYLCFWFEPTPEEQRKLWEKQVSYGTQYPSTEFHRAAFDLDILGLRAGGAAYYNEFHESREWDDAYRKDEDSEDD